MSFFWCKRKTEKQEVKEKPVREQLLENEIVNLKEYIASLESKSRDSTFSFDFNAVDAFSVERNWNNGKLCTIIGYLVNEQIIHDNGKILDKQSVKEWYLYCSDQQHEKLVKDFNESKKGK